MKSRRDAAALLAVGSLLFGLALDPAAAQGEAAAERGQAIARVLEKEGEVILRRAGAEEAAYLGSLLLAGDRIATGEEARVLIEFSDRSLLALGSNTDIVLDDYSRSQGSGPLKGFLTLLAGIMRMSLSQSTMAENFAIRTETAVASVRSTDWIVEVTESDTQVFVVSGVVRVADSENARGVDLKAGDGTSVAAGAAPKSPSVWGRPRVAKVLARTGS